MEIFQVTTTEHNQHVRDLFWEYLQWANAMLRQEFDISFDIKVMLEQDLLALEKFSPPGGRLLLAQDTTQVAGLACLRKIGEDTGEIKRMFVRPGYRGKGIGKALLSALIEEARQLGYSKVRLDSAKFMKAAHAMYQSCGFTEIGPYPESEIPSEFQSNWIFMERALI